MRVKPTLTMIAALLIPAAGSAQTSEPPPQVRQWIEEIQMLELQLQPVQQEAMQDSALQQREQEVAASVREAMLEADPSVGAKMERLETIVAEARKAQASGDEAKLASLGEEAKELEPAIREAQKEALEQPEVVADLERFREQLHARMIEIDPASEQRLERLAALTERVENALRSSGLG